MACGYSMARQGFQPNFCLLSKGEPPFCFVRYYYEYRLFEGCDDIVDV
jgi:hypothetical protein